MDQQKDAARSAMSAVSAQTAIAPPPLPWLRAEKPATKRRPPLTRDAILDAAVRVVDRHGAEALTMRSVAGELEMSVSALYKHVENKEQLLQLLLDRVVGELRVPPPDPEHWQAQVKDVARQIKDIFTRHRDLGSVALGRLPLGPNFVVSLEKQLAILRAGQLPDEIAAFAGDLIGLYVAAWCIEEAGIPEGGAHEIENFQRMLAGYFSSLPADDFPNITALAPALAGGDHAERFELGLEVIVRGLASYRQ
jgi:TetR/AcrR family tetracycline transcriptional repressor